MQGELDRPEIERRRRAARRMALGLVLVAVAIYAGFVLTGIYGAGS